MPIRTTTLFSTTAISMALIFVSACNSSSDNAPTTGDMSTTDGTTTIDETANEQQNSTGDAQTTGNTTTIDETSNEQETSTGGVPTTDDTTIVDEGSNEQETSTGDGTASNDGHTIPVFSCDEISTKFVTKGSANADLADPEVSASCVDDNVVINSNQIPDFPYIETSPGVPSVNELEFTIPAIPTVAETPIAVPALGALGVAINGIPIYGATEGTGGDVLSLGGGFTECGGHNGPGGYHYHTFDIDGSDYCLFSEAEATAEPQLFGYALDGYPIYSGNFQYTSSWYLSDPSLFATDTFSAHTFVEGSGDLDQCNGRTDANGNYAYYTTDSFPYTLGCYRGVVTQAEGGGGGGGRRP